MFCAFCLKECADTYCGDECEHIDAFIEAKPAANAIDLNQLVVASGTVLGEGAFGCVVKSADGRYAIKVQDVRGDERCVYESSLQDQLAKNVPKAIVSNVYFYSGNVSTIPNGWRNALLAGGCKKAPQWAARGWTGPFCVTVMDFVPGKEPLLIPKSDFALFCFGLLYTTTEGYEKIGFQHIDIKTPNILMTPTYGTSEKYRVCRLASEFKFESAKQIPRLLDFGISITKNMPVSINPLENRGGTLMTTPLEVVIGRLMSKTSNLKDFMYSPNKKSYHWSFDIYSIGITALAATVSPKPNMGFPLLPLPSAQPYINSFMQNQIQSNADSQMVLLYLYSVCVLQYLLGNGAYPSKNDASFDVFYPPGTIGYELLRSTTGTNIIDYIVKQDQGVLKPSVDYFRQTYGEEALKLIASLLHWNPDKRGGGRGKVLLHPFFTPYRRKIQCKPGGKVLQGVNPNDKAVVGRVNNEKRKERLKKYVKTLYHQTNAEAAKAIVASQHFRLGSTGYAGGGIYFTDSPEATEFKAHSKGVIIKADVFLGNSKTIYEKDTTITFEKLLREGVDSIFLIRPTGAEYVVYNSDQVKNVRYMDENDVLNLELARMYDANQAAGIMFFIVGTRKNKRVLLLGRELGGIYKGQFNMFGGRHDKKRTRAATARAEWCEEFGASSQGPSTECNAPEISQLKSAKKIFANNRIEKEGPNKTTIVILWNVGTRFTSRKTWNDNNRKARNDPNVPKSYKEMDALEIFDLNELFKIAKKTPQGSPAQVTPIDSSKKVTVSMFTLETVRNMKQKKYI
jgi:serine/threonine protein kinase